MDRPRSFAPWIATVLLLLPVAYVGSYLAMAQPGWVLHVCTHSGNGEIPLEPYRFGGEWSACLFWPVEQIDRKLRPSLWEHQDYDQRLRPGSRCIELYNPWENAATEDDS
jgi:hypothetical protein